MTDFSRLPVSFTKELLSGQAPTSTQVSPFRIEAPPRRLPRHLTPRLFLLKP